MANASLAHGPRLAGRASDGRAAPRRLRDLTAEAARYLGAVSILVVGAIHAQQYYDAYFYVVPTIGTLFLLSFIGAGIVGVVLVAPIRRLGRRVGDLILVLAALGGIGIAVGTFVSLLVSEYTPLFGFMESGYRLAIVLTLVFDVLSTVFLGFFLLVVGARLLRAIGADRGGFPPPGSGDVTGGRHTHDPSGAHLTPLLAAGWCALSR